MKTAALARLALAALLATPAAADNELMAEWSFGAARFALHPTEPLLYVSRTDLNSVAVIDTERLELVAELFVGSQPVGLALSEDGGRLFVATSGASQLGVVDTAALALLAPIDLPAQPSDVEVGLDGRVYVTPANSSVGIMIVDGLSGAYLGDFSLTVFVYSGGFLEISPDRTRLYFGNRGLSPATLAEFDVSAQTPTLVYKNPHGSLGSNGQDLALSRDGAYICFAVGSGNQGYVISKFRTSDYVAVGSYDTGPYPREVTFGPDDDAVYAVHFGAHVDAFDAHTFLPTDEIATASEARELVVERAGRYLFAAQDDALQAFSLDREDGAVFCSGHGLAGACPCGNAAGPVEGCANSTGGGAALVPTGGNSVAADDLGFNADGLVPLQPALLLVGTAELAGGDGLAFGDGLRCVGGDVIRLATESVGGAGRALFRPGLGALGGWGAGDARFFQAWYRDPVGGPCGAGFNTTNGVKLVFQP